MGGGHKGNLQHNIGPTVMISARSCKNYQSERTTYNARQYPQSYFGKAVQKHIKADVTEY